MTAPTSLGTFASTANVAAATNQTVTVSSGVSVGQMVLVAVVSGAGSVTTTVSDSKGNTYTKAASVSLASGNAETVDLWVCGSVATALVSGTDTVRCQRDSSGSLWFAAASLPSGTYSSTVGSPVYGSSTTAVNPATVASALTVPTSGELIFVAGTANTRTLAPTNVTTVATSSDSGTGNPRTGGLFYTETTGSITPAANQQVSGANSNGAYAALAVVLSPASSSFSGSASLSGSGTLTAAGAPTATASVSLSGSGALTASGVPTPAGSVSLSGSGTLTASGAQGGGGNANFSGSGTLTAAGNPTASGSVSLTGSGTLTATGKPAIPGSVSLSGSGTLTAARIHLHPTIAIIGDSLTYRSGSTASPPSREATTRSRFVAAGYDDYSIYWYGVGGKPMVGNDSLGNSAADVIAAAKAQLGTVDIWIIGLGTNDTGLSDSAFSAGASAILSAIGSTGKIYWMNLAYYSGANTNALHFNPLLATAISGVTNAKLLDWNTYIHAAGVYDTADWIFPTDSTHMTTQGWAKRDAYEINALQADFSDVASLSGSGTLTATGKPTASTTASLGGAGTLTASGTPSPAKTAALTGSGTLTAAAVPTTITTVALTGSGTLDYAAQVSIDAAADLAGDGTLTATGLADMTATPRGRILSSRLRISAATGHLRTPTATGRLRTPETAGRLR